MEIAIQKNTPIPVHQQLVTQISMQIASGVLPPGAKLPSIRALSQKLGVHHNTCLGVYRDLSEQGLIALKHGSGARVMSAEDGSRKEDGAASATLEQLAGFFVEQAIRKGASIDEANDALDAAFAKVFVKSLAPITFVDLHRDILPLFASELGRILGRPVRTALVNEVDEPLAHASHFIVSRYHINGLKARLEKFDVRGRDKITMIDVGSGQQEIKVMKALPIGALVSVVSISTIILQQAEAVITALRGDELLIRPIHYEQESEEDIRQIVNRSQAIFADVICEPLVKYLTHKPVHPIRVISDTEAAKLAAFRIEDYKLYEDEYANEAEEG